MLNFARNIQVSVQKVSLKRVVEDVLEFQTKEAGYRSITINVDIPDEIPEFFSDRGKLQQVFINLVNNAFAAMKDGGKLDIISRLDDDRQTDCHHGQRYRLRHSDGEHQENFRTLFHDQKRQRRHRPGIVDHLRSGQRNRRFDRY